MLKRRNLKEALELHPVAMPISVCADVPHMQKQGLASFNRPFIRTNGSQDAVGQPMGGEEITAIMHVGTARNREWPEGTLGKVSFHSFTRRHDAVAT